MLELRQFDLQLALVGLRALREDLENELGAVHHAAHDLPLHVALLRRRQRMVEHHVHGVDLGRGATDLVHLPAAGEKFRVGPRAAAPDHVVAPDPGAFHQAHHFLDALFVVSVAEIEAHDNRRLGIGGCGGSF